MFNPKIELLSHHLATLAEEIAQDPAAAGPWERAAEALGESRDKEADLTAAIDQRDLAALQTILAGWDSGEQLLPEQDREVLRRALKAFRKRIKVMRLDDESTIGGGATSGGRHSGLAGITPPDRYPQDVWDVLVRQERLIDAGHGVYELPPRT